MVNITFYLFIFSCFYPVILLLYPNFCSVGQTSERILFRQCREVIKYPIPYLARHKNGILQTKQITVEVMFLFLSKSSKEIGFHFSHKFINFTIIIFTIKIDTATITVILQSHYSNMDFVCSSQSGKYLFVPFLFFFQYDIRIILNIRHSLILLHSFFFIAISSQARFWSSFHTLISPHSAQSKHPNHRS